jgi:hypothetical protein
MEEVFAIYGSGCLAVAPAEPILELPQLRLADHSNIVFAGPGNIKQVCNHHEQHYKKPHWKHNACFNLL